MKKKLSAFLLAAILILLSVCGVASYGATPKPSENFYVADFADVISKETEDYLTTLNTALENACGAQIVIVAATGLGGDNIAHYAMSIFNEWGIGSAEKNNGVLFVMALAEDDYWAIQGKGLENELSSGLLGEILDDYVEDYFANDDFDMAAKVFAAKTYEKLCEIYSINTENNNGFNWNLDNWLNDIDTPTTRSEGSSVSFWECFVVLFIIFLILLKITSKKAATTAGGSYNNSSTGTGSSSSFWNGFLFGNLFGSSNKTSNHYSHPNNNSHNSYSSHSHSGSSFGSSHSSFGSSSHSSSHSSFGSSSHSSSHSSFGSSSHSSFGSSASHHGGGGSSRGGGAGRGRR